MRNYSFRFLATGIFLCVLAMGFTGCSDDESPLRQTDVISFTVTVGSTSSDVDLNSLTQLTIEGESAIKLAELVDTTVITEPDNYAYRVIGSDGFNAHSKGSPDNTWGHLQYGYVVLSTMRATFDTSLGLSKRYNISDAAELSIIRKIDFVTHADSLIQNVVTDFPKTAFQDGLIGIPLTDLMPSIGTPVTYNYQLVAVDGYSQTLTWEQFSTGWFIEDLDQVLYANSDAEGTIKVKKLNRIVAIDPGN
jgi:hypothetical protein